MALRSINAMTRIYVSKNGALDNNEFQFWQTWFFHSRQPFKAVLLRILHSAKEKRCANWCYRVCLLRFRRGMRIDVLCMEYSHITFHYRFHSALAILPTEILSVFSPVGDVDVLDDKLWLHVLKLEFIAVRRIRKVLSIAMNSHVVMDPPFVITNIIIVESTCLNEIKQKLFGKTFPYSNSWLGLLFRARYMSENTVELELWYLFY